MTPTGLEYAAGAGGEEPPVPAPPTAEQYQAARDVVEATEAWNLAISKAAKVGLDIHAAVHADEGAPLKPYLMCTVSKPVAKSGGK